VPARNRTKSTARTLMHRAMRAVLQYNAVPDPIAFFTDDLVEVERRRPYFLGESTMLNIARWQAGRADRCPVEDLVRKYIDTFEPASPRQNSTAPVSISSPICARVAGGVLM